MENEFHSIASGLDRWLREAALPFWWDVGADHQRGGFQELVGLDGRPTEVPRRARVQGRQSFVYAMAGALGWVGPWRDAAKHGLAFLNNHHKNAQGLFCTLVSPAGRVIDDAVTIYDQAFALLAMAWLYRVAPRDQSRIEAENVLAQLYRLRSSERGGFVETSPHAFQSNPHMHLFEAALAWCEIGQSANWNRLADEMASLCLTKFVDPDGGFVREYFDELWRPHAGPQGRIVEPGHQFEWAWLLERWARMRNDDRAKSVARKLFEVGTRGIDRERGVAVDEMDGHFNITRNSARLWPQTERLKAALILSETAAGETRSHYLKEAVEASRVLLRYLDTPVVGIWRDKLQPNDKFIEEPAPASSFYHIICAIAAVKEAAAK